MTDSGTTNWAWTPRLIILSATPLALTAYALFLGGASGPVEALGMALASMFWFGPLFLLQLIFWTTFLIALVSADDLAIVVHGVFGLLAAVATMELHGALGTV